MSDTPRHITRRPAVSSPRAALAAPVTSPGRIEALRQLVAAGKYDVNPRSLAGRIFRAAGVKLP